MPSHYLFPRYRYPIGVLWGVMRDVLLLRPRYFQVDALACIELLNPPLNVFGREYIPDKGPCLVTFNHYSRPGFHAWWIALAIASLLPKEAHFVMTDELTFPGKWYGAAGRVVSHWSLKRAAKVYGFSSMPPMPPREKDVDARARSVREVLSFVERAKDPIICLAPEGGDMPGGRLAYPPSGVGRFIRHIASKGLRVVPAGVWEQDRSMCVSFGMGYELPVLRGTSPDERDRAAAKTVMEAIAKLLPSHLRGEFQ